MSSYRKAAILLTLGAALITAIGAGVAAHQSQQSSHGRVDSPSEVGGITSKPITSKPITSKPIASKPASSETVALTSAAPDAITPPDVYLAMVRRDQQQQGEPFTAQRVVVKDEAVAGTDFAAVKTKMRRIVRDRDAQALREIADPNIHLTFGRPITLDDLDIDDPDAIAWKQLERTFDAGCATDTPEPPHAYWACPPAFLATGEAPDLDPYESIIITGSDVAVRQLPSTSSPVLKRVSNVSLKQGGYLYSDPEQLSDIEQQQLEDWYRSASTNQGWQYVQLPDGRKGFVSSRYAFSPIGYRAVFTRTDAGDWSMTAFIAGD